MTRSRAVAAARRVRRRRAMHASAGLAAVALALAGCSTLSPAQVVEPYQVADGTRATLHDPGTGAVIQLDDMLVVAARSGGPGTLIGTASTTGDKDVTLALSLVSTATPSPSAAAGQAGAGQPITLARVPADGLLKFGPQGEAVTVTNVPVPPGATVTMRAAVQSGESVEWSVPVLERAGSYASVTIATPSTSTTVSGTPTPGATASESTPATVTTTTP